jgi:WD40 repeat protein
VLRPAERTYSIAISPDGATLATGSLEGFIEFWDTTSGAPSGALLASIERYDANADKIADDGRVNRILSLAYSRDGHQLASGSPSAARVWDMSDESGVDATFKPRPEDQFLSFVFDHSLTCTYAIDAGWTVDKFGLKKGQHQTRLRQYNAYAEPMPTTTMLAVDSQQHFVATGAPNGKLEILDAETGKQIAMLTDERGDFIFAEFLGDDGKLLGIVDCALERGPAWAASVWDTSNRRLLNELPLYETKVTTLATHPRNNLFAAGTGSVASVYDLSTGALVAQLGGHSKDICQLAFSPDGTLLASVCNDHIARIWDWQRESELHRLIGSYTETLSAIAFSPDGRTVVTGEHGGWVRFWNTAIGRELLHLRAPGQPRRLQFSADGKRLACWSAHSGSEGQHEVRVWSIESPPSEIVALPAVKKR